MAAVAGVDAQLVQDLLVVGGDLIAAKLAQISGRHTVCCGIGAGVDALAAGVHLPTGEVFVAHIIADGDDLDCAHRIRSFPSVSVCDLPHIAAGC